ncbi:MAG: diguanylate cyclase [Proteobacteria bacterium]|nr:diguanylate cyclase [Pseudomonadota bacterium]
MKKISQSKISRKFFLILLLISFSAVSGLSIFQIITSYYEGKKNVGNHQKEQLINISKEIYDRLYLVEKMMELSSHSKGVLEEGINERFRFYLWKILKHNPSIFEVSAVGIEGREIIYASKLRSEINADLKDVSNEEFFKESIQGKAFYSKVQHGFDNTKPYMIISVPIFRFDGTITGVLVSKLWFVDIQKMLLNTAFGDTGYAFITDDHLEIIAHSKFELVIKHEDIRRELSGIERILYRSLENGGVFQHGAFSDKSGEKFICTSIYLPKFNWIISVAQNEKDVFANTYRIIMSFLIVSGLLFVFVFVISRKVSETIAEPIVKLRDLTSRISEGNFNEKITVETKDEIEDLANNFNQMSERLKEIYGDLEKRIDERTKELLLLYSFTSAVSKSLNVNETIKTAGDELITVLELDGYICVLKDDGDLDVKNTISSLSNEDEVKNVLEEIIGKGILSYVSKHHVPYYMEIDDDSMTLEDKKLLTIHSIAVFPVLFQGSIIANFILLSELKGVFNSNVLSAIETCMIQLGVSIANAQRYEITEELSFKDPLTKLFNRRFFETKLENEFARCQRYNRVSSLCMVDIDHFKKINDTYGHQAGDAILRQLAEIILSSIRKSDVPARYGGEEFIILMTESSPDKAYIAAERLRKRVEEHAFVIDVDPGYIYITISIGIAGFVSYMTTKEEFIEQADRALYTAKQTGRNKVCM